MDECFYRRFCWTILAIVRKILAYCNTNVKFNANNGNNFQIFTYHNYVMLQEKMFSDENISILSRV